MTPARPLAIVGIGASELGGDLPASAGILAAGAWRAALADTGIDAAEDLGSGWNEIERLRAKEVI